jgi:hypothetical protein
MIKNKLFSPINQWLAVNKELKLYQLATAFLALVVLFLILLVFLVLNPDPIVISDQSPKEYRIGKYIATGPTQEDVQIFLTEFIRLRYQMTNGEIDKTVGNIRPLSTEGYIQALLKEVKEGVSGGGVANVDQYAANIETIVNEKEALAKFDKIIRINGIPLLVPTEMSFQLIRTKPTKWNPYGILVNGVIEHENK